MFIGDLRLPNGQIMEYLTGNVIDRDPVATDIPWEVLAGPGIFIASQGSSEPAIGCQTGGDKVANHLMRKLAEK